MPVRSTRIITSLMPIMGVGTSLSQRPGADSALTNAFIVAGTPGGRSGMVGRSYAVSSTPKHMPSSKMARPIPMSNPALYSGLPRRLR